MSGEWARYNEYLYRSDELGLSLDISRMRFPDGWPAGMEDQIQAAYRAMEALEGGAVANPDEGWRVGHYWLRAPELAPEEPIRGAIARARRAVEEFAARVRSGDLAPERGGRFRRLLLAGIGGSALGPQLLADALGDPAMEIRPHFLDNTDPDGIRRTLAEIGGELDRTLALVVSKSGGTAETRNGMREAEAAYRAAGLSFARHAAAVTREGSILDSQAGREGWLARFPMWDWVGGRTSLCSAVGLLPAALLGFDTDALLRGAREMDAATRARETRRNPAALLALMWHHAGGGRGEKDMVVLPYRDRLALFPRYLQQLVMESLGKKLDLEGRAVHQGLVVYGNKGSTDQHAYIQQLREGPDNFFAVFIQVLRDRSGPALEVEPGVTSGDYLAGFLQGTRQALWEEGRESITITLEELDAAALGRLIALFERAVGFYASLVGINAYHQPGVEAGKIAAGRVLELQKRALEALGSAGRALTAGETAAAIGAGEEVESIYLILRRLSAAPGRGVFRTSGPYPRDDRFRAGQD